MPPRCYDDSEAPAVSHARSWTFGIGAAAAAAVSTAATWRWLEPSASPLFLAAILLVTLYGGLEAGLITTALCIPALVVFLRPPYSGLVSGIETTARIAVFAGVATLATVLIGERRRQEKLRRRAERDFRLIFETATDGIVTLDDANRIVLANPAASKIFGRPRDHLVGQPLAALLPPDAIPLLRPGEAMESMALRADGSRVAVEVCVVDMADARGLMAAFVRDITSRKEAEDARVEQLRRTTLRADIAAALASAGGVDEMLRRCAEAMVAAFDAALARIWVVADSEPVLMLRASAGLSTPIDGRYGRIPIGAIRVGLIAETRWPSVTNDFRNDPHIDDPGWVEREHLTAVAGYPLLVEGRVIGVAAIFCRHAISPATSDTLASIADPIAQAIERRQAEDMVRRREALLADAEALSHTGSWAWHRRTGAIFWSQETYRIFNVPPGTPLDLAGIARLLAPEDRAVLETELEAIRQKAGEFDREYRVRLADGTQKYVHVFGRPIAGGDEFIGAVMDVTARKQAEDDLHAARARLAEAIRFSTMGELAASIAHEVNQPLAAVVTNAQACSLLLRSPESSLDQVKEAVADIADAGKRASDVIKRIRVLLSKGTPRAGTLDVNASVRHVLALMNRELAKHDVRISLELDSDMPPTEADPGLVEQVLINLVNNAIEAMALVHERPRRLTIRSTLNAEGAIEVGVCDSGGGINPAYADRIFDPFVTTKADGMGMGLAVCRNIVASCGGRLWATTSESGTAVRFTLRPIEGRE